MDFENLQSASERNSCADQSVKERPSSPHDERQQEGNGRKRTGGVGKLTISSLIPLTFPQALITNASLLAITQTRSTPFPRISAIFSIYPGRCLTEQPGVNAPGTAKRTTFLSLNSWLALKVMGMPQDVGDSVSGDQGMYLKERLVSDQVLG